MNAFIVRNTFIDGFAPDDGSSASSGKPSSDPLSSRSRSQSIESCSDDSRNQIVRDPGAIGTASSHFDPVGGILRDHNRGRNSKEPLSNNCTLRADAQYLNASHDMTFELHQPLTHPRKNEIYWEWENVHGNSVPEGVFAVDAENTTYLGPDAVDILYTNVPAYPVRLTLRGGGYSAAASSNGTASDRCVAVDPNAQQPQKKERVLSAPEVLRRRKHAQARRQRISQARAEERARAQDGSSQVLSDGYVAPGWNAPTYDRGGVVSFYKLSL